MNNLKKFATEADYSAATLNYPAVSWVTATDNVHFDKSAPTPPTPTNDKVMIASYGGDSGEPGRFNLYNCDASTSSDITAITLDDVAVEPITCKTDSTFDASQLHIAKYDLNTTTVGDWCTGDLGCMHSSNFAHLDILIPSQITHIAGMPNNATNLVIEATIPPTTDMNQSAFAHPVYVPDSALSAYQNDATWGEWGEFLKPISQYSGVLPV